MAANDTAALSNVDSAAALLEDLPVAIVSASGLVVIVQWGDEETRAPLETLYSIDSYSFSVVKSNGKEPTVKTFGSLFGCDGGTLTIGETRYRIQVIQQQQDGEGNQHEYVLKNPAPVKKPRLAPEFRSISSNELLQPEDVIPPKSENPEFVCSDGWLSSVKDEITACLQRSDDGAATDKINDSIDRIPPMALVRCSRGGKTRALYEIANKMRGHNAVIDSYLACLYVSFNDYSSLQRWEQEDPLQALLRRIAFNALSLSPNAIQTASGVRFGRFLEDKPIWEKQSFLKWIKDTPCVLLIDEMNNLDKLKEENSDEASEFGDFIKRHFLGKENRYLVFTSHILGTLPFFGNFVDPSKGSARPTTLQELPLVPSLKKAHKLRQSLDSTREAVYYGLIPGMIFESGCQRKNISGKRGVAVEKFLSRITSPNEFQHAFLAILKSLLDGNWRIVPKELHTLLDSTSHKDGITHYIRWVPYHLQYVLGQLGTSIHNNSKLAEKLSDLCNLIPESKEQSGEGWESLFVLFLVARCLNKMPDEITVPAEWFDSSPTICFNGPYSATQNKDRSIGECKTWDELKKGLVHGQEPQLSIWYPTHNSFEVYDVLVVYSDAGRPVSIYGYQLKEGTATRTHQVHSDMKKSLFVQGVPPKKLWIKTPKDGQFQAKMLSMSFLESQANIGHQKAGRSSVPIKDRMPCNFSSQNLTHCDTSCVCFLTSHLACLGLL